MTSKKVEATRQKVAKTLTDDDIVTERKIGRRSFLARTGAIVIGAIGIVVAGCAGGGGGGGGRIGGGYRPSPSGTRSRDSKWGDGHDVDVSADFNDLDSDTRDTSDHYRTETKDWSSANDHD